MAGRSLIRFDEELHLKYDTETMVAAIKEVGPDAHLEAARAVHTPLLQRTAAAFERMRPVRTLPPAAPARRVGYPVRAAALAAAGRAFVRGKYADRDPKSRIWRGTANPLWLRGRGAAQAGVRVCVARGAHG